MEPESRERTILRMAVYGAYPVVAVGLAFTVGASVGAVWGWALAALAVVGAAVYVAATEPVVLPPPPVSKLPGIPRMLGAPPLTLPAVSNDNGPPRSASRDYGDG